VGGEKGQITRRKRGVRNRPRQVQAGPAQKKFKGISKNARKRTPGCGSVRKPTKGTAHDDVEGAEGGAARREGGERRRANSPSSNRGQLKEKTGTFMEKVGGGERGGGKGYDSR